MSKHFPHGKNIKQFPPFVKYDSIIPIDEVLEIDGLSSQVSDLMVFEKVDGGNCQVRFRSSDNQLFFGTRSNYLTGGYINARPWFPKFVEWGWRNSSLYNLPEGIIMYGEWLSDHTIEYDSANRDQFFLLDVFDLESNRFKPYDEGIDFLASKGVSGFRTLPILARGSISSIEVGRFISGRLSDFYDGPLEGVVIKDYSSTPQRAWKLLHPDFDESRVDRFEKGRVVRGYLEPSRFTKAFYRLLDAGAPYVTRDELVQEVIADVTKERGEVYLVPRVKKKLEDLISQGALDTIMNNPSYQLYHNQD